MTDKKLTDNEIIKALEECIELRFDDTEYATVRLDTLTNALDLITCQQAENENLKVENQSLRSAANSLKMHYEEAQAEIERLRKEVNLVSIQFQDLQERYEEAQAEVESLKIFRGYAEKRASDYKTMRDKYLNAKSEAYKEFAEKLENICEEIMAQEWNEKTAPISWSYAYAGFIDDIDTLLKEMVGENND